MRTTVTSARINGLNAEKVSISAEATTGLGIHLVGMPDMNAKESLLRSVTALQSVGYKMPGKKIVIDVSQAVTGDTTRFDLPITLAILSATGQEPLAHIDDYIIAGELGLDGSVRSVAGSLCMADLAGKESKNLILSLRDAVYANEFAPKGVRIIGVSNLSEVVGILNGKVPVEAESPADAKEVKCIDLKDIPGNEKLKRAAMIAAAGGHSMLFLKNPTEDGERVIRAITDILPAPTEDELHEMNLISSAAHGFPVHARPFVESSYYKSIARFAGGGVGDTIEPGAVSFAHGGVLRMYNLLETNPTLQDVMRVTREDGKISLVRTRQKATYPASYLLVANLGKLPEDPGSRRRAVLKLNHALLDLIDLRMDDPDAPNAKAPLTTQEAAKKVATAREIQKKRFEGTDISVNAKMTTGKIALYCSIEKSAAPEMNALEELPAVDRRNILKVAQTVADLEGHEKISSDDLKEARSFYTSFYDSTPALRHKVPVARHLL